MLVGRIIVDDGVDHFSHRDLLLDRIEEADELLVAMMLHVAADDGGVEDASSQNSDRLQPLDRAEFVLPASGVWISGRDHQNRFVGKLRVPEGKP
jgi:hypothetical protein